MLHLNPAHWSGTIEWPSRKDVRWIVFSLLLSYLLIGVFFLGFSRNPLQVLSIISLAAVFDMLFNGLFKGKWVFPLSGVITSLSLSILLNYSYSFEYLWIPIFVAMISKHVFTLNGKHFFNPAMFAIAFSVIFLKDVISLAPAYQWYGSAESAWVMGWFVLTAALLLFIFKIDRAALSLSFLFFFAIATLIRAYIMRHIVPFETLFVGAMTSPAFYLFAFYMITDPATSPPKRREQIMLGFFIAALDLLFHKKLSYYTFFFAGISVATARFLFKHLQAFRQQPQAYLKAIPISLPLRATALGCLLFPLFSFFYFTKKAKVENPEFRLERIPDSHSGLSWRKSNLLEETDPRVAHVAKWVLSVGDAVACADVNNDGLQDVFLTQMLKTPDWQAKLYLNKGNFQFEKRSIKPLENYLGNPKKFGLPAFGMFLDYDNDGDQDLFTGFVFGESHLFENRLIPDNALEFREMPASYLSQNKSICLGASALDYDKDGFTDIFFANTLSPYLRDYLPEKVAFNLFDLPAPRYEGDRRMFHFLHESWQNANDGGRNYMLHNTQGQDFVEDTLLSRFLPETRWSLVVGTSDLNQDGWTDLYIANDFGRDDCYLNIGGKALRRQQGRFYGEVGLDTYKSMNVSIADFDGNGLEDIYESNVYHEMQAEGSLLWLNQTSAGSNSVNLKERASQFNILNINRFGWGAAACDLDLDGWPDLVQANGMVGDEWDKKGEKRDDYWYYQAQVARTPPEIHSFADKWADIRGRCIYENEPDCVFMNRDGKSFVDVAPAVGLNHLNNTRGVAAVDFDNDGDEDLLITDQFGAPKLYKNEQKKNKHWLGIKILGNGNDVASDAIGAKICLKTADRTWFKEVHSISGFSAQGDRRLHFGVGENLPSNAQIRILWPNGEEDVYPVEQWDKYIEIKQKQPSKG